MYKRLCVCVREWKFSDNYAFQLKASALMVSSNFIFVEQKNALYNNETICPQVQSNFSKCS